MDTKKLGALGERIACEYLVEKGYKILAKNYRISFGEIDIIAKRKRRFFTYNDKTIHFVEVKTLLVQSFHPERNEGFPTAVQAFFPEDHVNYKKQKKLRQLAQIWLEKKGFLQDYPYQIDIIGILVDKNTRKTEVKYFLNAVSDI